MRLKGLITVNTIKFEAYKELSEAVAREMAELAAKKPGALFCVAAGHSSLGVFNAAVDMYSKGLIDFSQSYFVAMDEWLGMSVRMPGSCGDFLTRNFLSKVNFPKGNVRLFDGTVAPPEGECEAVGAYIAGRGGIDYIVLGVGMNGHLALNEPGTAFDASVHVTALDEVTARVGQKYFDGRKTELSGGLTIGLREITASKRAVLCVNGVKKAEVLKRTLTGPVGADFPATALRGMNNASVYYDAEAGGL